MAPRNKPTQDQMSQQQALAELNALAGSSTASSNPLGTTAEMQMKVSGVGSILGFQWGTVTVLTALQGFEKLSSIAHGHGPGAKAAKQELAQIQNDMYVAGLYGSQKPVLGSLGVGDLKAFKLAAVGAASTGQGIDQWLPQRASDAQANGTSGGGTHVIPAKVLQEKVWSPEDIKAAIDGATTATGENLAQKLIGHDATPAQLQAIADALNAQQSVQTNADVAGAIAGQQENIATQEAIAGLPPSASITPGGQGGTYTPQQVADEVARQGGSVAQQQVAAALVSGIESNGSLTELAGGQGPAAGLFQFEPGTWTGNGGGKNGIPARVVDANLQQQVAVFINATKGDHFRPWGPDVSANRGNPNDPSNPAYSYTGAPQPGSVVANYIQSAGIKTSGSGAGAATNPNASSFSPVGPGLKQGRIDQGVDFSGKGSLFAVGSGQILSVSARGWPGGTFIALKLDNPVDPQHSVVYYAEDITAGVKVGQHVSAGATIGYANGGSSGIELGWMNPNALGQPLNQVSNPGQFKGNNATSEGQNFVNFIKGSSDITGTAPNGTKTDVYQQPIINPVPANLDPVEAASQYFENQDSPQYQQNNLLRVFQQVESSLKTPATPNVGVRNTPVDMKAQP